MRNVQRLESTVQPFYSQLEQLGVLYEDGSLSSSFLRTARHVFAKQYFKELKMLMRAENRVLKHEFRIQRSKDRAKFARERRVLKKRLKAQCKQEE